AYDYAGNFSDTVTIDNPYYVEEEQECPTPKPTKRPSGSGSSSKATPTVVTQYIPLGPGHNKYGFANFNFRSIFFS
ncbi:MAG: hypothetical protein II217_02690, partial [Alistipes sp.]|nr:hypothetical protein [Alistipes sp.]